MVKYFLFLVVLTISFTSCVEVTKPFNQIPPGIWRAELKISDKVTLPFNFESTYDSNQKLQIDIINGDERIPVEDLSFGRTNDLRDTIVMKFPLMDSYIVGQYKENVIEGHWHVNYRENYSIPFVAFYGQAHRFTTDKKEPALNLSGKWEVTFEVETEDAYPAVGEFLQLENNLSGTFLTETGDYRYLQGTVQDAEFYLSCFDGGHAFLFTGKINPGNSLTGKFYSGKHYETNWVASSNPDVVLTNPYNLSQITTPDKKIDFALPDTHGNSVSLTDDNYKGKPKLITIMGTWCPNCLDESKFLINYVKNNPKLELEIIALAFEKYRDKEKSLSIIKNYKDRLGIPYPMLYAGYYDKEEATNSLGFIDKVISYPTLLFVDQNNVVKRVHTGFAGPATSKYLEFQEEFEESVQLIVDTEL